MLTFKSKIKEVEAQLANEKEANYKLLEQVSALEKENEAFKKEKELNATVNVTELQASFEALKNDKAKVDAEYQALLEKVTKLEAEKKSAEELASEKAMLIVASQGVPAIANVNVAGEVDPLSKLETLHPSDRFAYFQANQDKIRKAILNTK